MHVAILTQYFPPEMGAPQVRLSELASHIVRRGHQVTVLTAMPNYPTGRVLPGYGGLVRREHRDGVPVIRTAIYPTQKLDRLRRLGSYFSFVVSSGIVGPFTLGRPDVLLVESPPLFLGLSGLWLSRITGARLIFNVSDLWPESAVRLGLLSNRGLAYRLSTALEARCYRAAWLVTGQSRETVADIASRFPRTNTLHVSNGVDTSRFGPERATPDARLALGDPSDCVVFYAGLHGLAQGLDQIVDTAAAFRHDGNLRFVFMGDGPEKPQLQERARSARLSYVRFLEPQPAAAMPTYLAAADIIVVALRTELPGAVPSKLYEAMASGRPVVLVATGEAAGIVETHQAGLAVAPGDIDGIASAISRLRRDPALRGLLGSNGRRAAERCFDRAQIAARFIDYLETHMPPTVVRPANARPAGSLTS